MHWVYEMRTLAQELCAFPQTLPYQPDLTVFQIAQPTVNNSCRSARSSGREVLLFYEKGPAA